MSWTEINGDELAEPDIIMNDMLKAFQSTRKTVTSQDLFRHEQFANDFGMEG